MSNNGVLTMNEPITEETVTAAYYKYRTMRYLLEHPEADSGKAYKYARVAWSRKRKTRPLRDPTQRNEG